MFFDVLEERAPLPPARIDSDTSFQIVVEVVIEGAYDRRIEDHHVDLFIAVEGSGVENRRASSVFIGHALRHLLEKGHSRDLTRQPFGRPAALVRRF